jgi:Flp pilus assembly protein CpaB
MLQTNNANRSRLDDDTIAINRPRPNLRALIGGLLIAGAAIGAYEAATARPPSTIYVAAASYIPAGSRINPSELTNEPAELEDANSASLYFRSASEVTGSWALAPIQAGELIGPGMIARGLPSANTREISFAVDSDRAMGGALLPGEQVDVIATYGTGTSAISTIAAADAKVLSVVPESGGFGAAPVDVVTLEVERANQLLALANALNAGEVYLVLVSPAGTERSR